MSKVFDHHSLREAAQKTHELGLRFIEICTGGYHTKNLCNLDELLADRSALAAFRDTLAEFELNISAFNLAGEPLNPDPAIAGTYDKEFRDTCTPLGFEADTV